MRSYYVYIAYLNNIPKYIGFGHGKRIAHVNSGVSHVRKLNEMVLKFDVTFDVVKTDENLTYEEAQEIEISYIEKYGIEETGGTLYNQTKGGVGYRSKHTNNVKAKISEASKKMWEERSHDDNKKIIDNLLENGLKTRFKKGDKSKSIARWRLTDNNTGMVYEYEGKHLGPKSEFVIGMKPNHHYKSGKYLNWYLEKIS